MKTWERLLLILVAGFAFGQILGLFVYRVLH